MKTIKIDGKKMKTVDLKSLEIDKIIAHVKRMCYDSECEGYVKNCMYEELEDMLFRLAR